MSNRFTRGLSTWYCGSLPCEPESWLLLAISCFDQAQMILMWPTLRLLSYSCMHIFYPVLSIVVLVLMLLNKENLNLKYYIFRLTYAAARNGHMYSLFSFISVERLTPSPAVIFNVSLCLKLSYWIEFGFACHS